MTAVEWLQMKMATSSAEEMVGNINTWFKQAKKMEKEQKIKFAENCLDKALDLDIRTAFSNVEKYYNETFK